MLQAEEHIQEVSAMKRQPSKWAGTTGTRRTEAVLVCVAESIFVVISLYFG